MSRIQCKSRPWTLLHAVAVLALLAPFFASAESLSLIPSPRTIVASDDGFRITANTTVAHDSNADRAAGALMEALHLSKGSGRRGISLRINRTVVGDEAYRLRVTPRGITIEASSDRG